MMPYKDIFLYYNQYELQLRDNGKHLLKQPQATYSINMQDAEIVCQWIKTLKLVDSYALYIPNCVDEDYTISKFKSHNYHVFLQRIIPVVFRDLIPNPLWSAMTELCNLFRVITSSSLVM